ncbi:hypothetical protein H2204_001263 [Knufia peltigerae]|uniref:Uncharacterized protein n=1 Tax=Knufia peltigerae TaxID=1002370 RepID=A0AA38YEI3_9EURO|nr:hypothetical protein H2204_001263 [Knufia peltigerae]
MSDKGKDEKARESFASILSYYQHNRKSLENVPTWVDRPESGTIMIGLAKDTVPSADQTEKNKRKLKELLAAQEAIDKLSPLERQIMSQAANSSKARRPASRIPWADPPRPEIGSSRTGARLLGESISKYLSALEDDGTVVQGAQKFRNVVVAAQEVRNFPLRTNLGVIVALASLHHSSLIEGVHVDTIPSL